MGYTTPVPSGSDVTAAVELPNLGSAPVTAAPTALVTAPQLPSEAGYDDLLLKQAGFHLYRRILILVEALGKH